MKERKTGKTIIKIILLAAVLAVLLLPARYINSAAGYFGFFFFAILLVFSVLGMLVLKRSISIDADFESGSCTRGDSMKTGLFIRNRSFMISPRANTVFFLSDLFGETAQKREVTFVMGARTKNDFGFRTQMEHIGVFTVGMKDLTVCDMTGLFRIRIPIRGEYEVVVLPRLFDLDDAIISEEAESEEDAAGSVQVGGMDYAGVREYALGDSMKQIHWKLSAHSNGYLTKLTESSRQKSYVILLDFAAPDYETEDLMDINDCLIETALSVTRYLAEHDEAYSLIYVDRKMTIHRVIPAEEPDPNLVRDFSRIFPGTDEKFPDAAKLLEEEGSMSNRSSNVILCTSRVDGDTIQEILQVKQQRRSPELFYILPERLNSREREKRTLPLGALDEAGIVYHVRSTMVNRTGKQAEPGMERVSGGRQAEPETEGAPDGKAAESGPKRTSAGKAGASAAKGGSVGKAEKSAGGGAR